MLRLLAFVVVVALFAGCASERVAVDDAEPPPAEAAGVFPPPRVADSVSILVAPPVVLDSLPGRQEAVGG